MTYDDGMRSLRPVEAGERPAPNASRSGASDPSVGTSSLLLSARPAGPMSRWLARLAIGGSILLFLLLVEFAKLPMAAHPNFIPLVQTFLVSNDLITALLLVLQLRVTRSPALLVLACGYFYTALMAAAHMLTFPAVFSPAGLLGAGPQTTAYLFVLWHVGYPLSILGYCVLKQRVYARALPRLPVAAALCITVLIAVAATLAATVGHDAFPPMLDGNHYSSEFNVGRYGQWLLTAVAILVVWKRGRSALDLWLLVALWSWFIEIALVAIFNAGRYDLGFYAGRVSGLLSSMFVLAGLLVEQARLYAELLASTEKERAGAEVRANRNVLRLAMAAGGMGAWSYDLARGQAWISVELEQILGFAPDTFSGRPNALLRRVHRQDVIRLRQVMRSASSDGDDFALDIRFCHKRGEWQWLDVRGRAVHDTEGFPARLVGVGMDVTARKRGDEAQATMAAALQENDRRKDEFLATLAHELRNPLAPIRNSVEVLGLMGPLPPAIERMRGVVDRQSKQLARLVDDLLDVSRITQHKMRLDRRLLPVTECLRDALEATRAAADAAGHRMDIAIDEDMRVDGDPTRLTQVFVNLLNNAIKFTPPGGRILVHARRLHAQVFVTVRDSGIGIAAEHLDSIFGIFTQVQQGSTQGHGGLGIGLALVRGFVELHDGSVQVASEGIGKGTEFTVRLPLCTAGSGGATVASETGVRAGLARRVLVVDDNPDATDALRSLLQLASHSVEEAHEGLHALRVAETFRPEVVLLDIGMPGMDGFELLGAMRARLGTGVIFVAVTGWTQEHDRTTVLDAGFDAYLSKPVDLADLEGVFAASAGARPVAST